MQVGTSTCQENEERHSGTECVENQLYPEKMCRVKILRSWADESPLNAKVFFKLQKLPASLVLKVLE